MFESLSAVDPAADEAALTACIAELETVKSAAAVGQARAAALLDGPTPTPEPTNRPQRNRDPRRHRVDRLAPA